MEEFFAQQSSENLSSAKGNVAGEVLSFIWLTVCLKKCIFLQERKQRDQSVICQGRTLLLMQY